MVVVKRKNKKKGRKKKNRLSLKGKRELRLKYLQYKLEKEVDMRDHVIFDIEKTWKTFLMKIKLPILQENAVILQCVFENAIDKKNLFITELYAQIKEQHRYKLSEFLAYIQNQIHDFKVFICNMKIDYEIDLEKICDRGKREITYITDTYNDNMKKMIILNSSAIDDKNQFDDGLQGLAYNEIFYKLIEFEERNKIMQIERKILQDKILNKYNIFLENFTQNISIKQKMSEKMEARESKSSKIIRKLNKTIDNKKILVRRLKKELRECEIRSKNLYQDKINTHTLRMKINKTCLIDQKNFNHLIECCDDTLKILNSLLEKGKCIIILHNLCRKYQSDKDEVQYLLNKEYLILFMKELQAFDEMNNPEYKMMEFHWARVVQAQAENKMLAEEKKKLMKENEILRNEVKKCLSSSKRDSEAVQVSKGSPCVVDASMMLKNKHPKQ